MSIVEGFLVCALAFAFALSGCAGKDGSNGAAGSNGKSPLVGIYPATPGQCPTGGTVISVNGATQVVCNGAQGDPGPSGPQGAPAPTPTPALDNPIFDQVNAYNLYRESLGQAALTPGLTCNLYTVPQTTTQIIGATLTGIGSFLFTGQFNDANQPVSNGFQVLPLALQGIYQTWFIVKCTGYLVVLNNGWTEFDTTSDDGSNLYVNGALVVNNDGLHGAQEKIGAKFLQAGVVSTELDFLQASGNQALIVNMNNALLSPNLLYH